MDMKRKVKSFVQLLLSTKGILINQSKDNQATPLFAACEQGYQDVVRLLLQTRGISSNQPKDNGSTPLFVVQLVNMQMN